MEQTRPANLRFASRNRSSCHHNGRPLAESTRRGRALAFFCSARRQGCDIYLLRGKSTPPGAFLEASLQIASLISYSKSRRAFTFPVFRYMSTFAVREILATRGRLPYVDGSILQVIQKVGRLTVATCRVPLDAAIICRVQTCNSLFPSQRLHVQGHHPRR